MPPPTNLGAPSALEDGAGILSGTVDLLAIGIIRKPHGVRGEASVELWTDSAERFDRLREAFLVSPDSATVRAVHLVSCRAHQGRVLLSFEGISSPEEVALLRNWTIEIGTSEARPLEPDEYFLHDLVGLAVVRPDGETVGVVTDAFEGGGGILLRVEKLGGYGFDLPFVRKICLDVDLSSKRITAEIPDGLEDLEQGAATGGKTAEKTSSGHRWRRNRATETA